MDNRDNKNQFYSQKNEIYTSYRSLYIIHNKPLEYQMNGSPKFGSPTRTIGSPTRTIGSPTHTIGNLQINDHTDQFMQYVSQDPASKETGDHKIDMTKSSVRPIDRIISKLDGQIDELQKIVAQSHDFSTSIDSISKKFKICAHQINLTSGQAFNSIKVYEKTEPLLYRHYVLHIKDKLQKVESISSKFKSYGFEEEKQPETVDNYMPTSQLIQQNNSDIELDEKIDRRAQSIQQISQSMCEIHQSFVEAQIMIAMQGEQIDHIDQTVMKSLEYVEDGGKELNKALEYHNTGNRCKIWILIIVIILGIISLITTYLITKSN
jgi:hypothetical protein